MGDVEIRGGLKKPLRIGARLVPRLIDEIPVLAVAACFAPGESRIRGARELRVKETDRLKSLALNLARLGARVRELEDGLVIRGGTGLEGGECLSFGDHRTAMAAVVAGLAARGPTVVYDTSCIRTSFPGFVPSLLKLIR